MRQQHACAVRSKLLMLVVPFLKRWNYTRVLEQARPASSPPASAADAHGCVGCSITAVVVRSICPRDKERAGSTSKYVRTPSKMPCCCCLARGRAQLRASMDAPSGEISTLRVGGADIGRAQVPAAAAGCERPRPVHPLHGRQHLLPAGQRGARPGGHLVARQHVWHGARPGWVSLSLPKCPPMQLTQAASTHSG